MRIVHVTSVHPWADVRIFHKMCRSLAQAGHEVHLVAPEPAQPPVSMRQQGVELHFIPRHRTRLDRVLGTARAARTAALALAPDIIHFHDPELIPQFAGVGMGHNTRVVYDVHEDHRVSVVDRSWAPRPIRPALGWGVGAFEDWSAPKFAAIVSATPRIAQRFSRHPRSIVVQNFPELEADPFTTGATAPKVAGRFVYVGGISAVRCATEMIDAVFEAGPPAALDLAGSWQPAGLAQSCRQRPGWVAVHEHGYLDRTAVFRLLSSAVAGLVLFQPLRNHVEAQPNKLFEYMLAGLPVIASDFPLWRALIEPDQAGLLVPPDSVSRIAEAMRWVMEHPDDALAMGQRGRAAVLARYNWQGEFNRLLELYQQLGQ